MKVLVKGSIEKVGATAFDRGMFNAGLFSQGKLLGEGPVDENGSYAFSIEAAELPIGAELALYPASVKAEDAGIMALRAICTPRATQDHLCPPGAICNRRSNCAAV